VAHARTLIAEKLFPASSELLVGQGFDRLLEKSNLGEKNITDMLVLLRFLYALESVVWTIIEKVLLPKYSYSISIYLLHRHDVYDCSNAFFYKRVKTVSREQVQALRDVVHDTILLAPKMNRNALKVVVKADKENGEYLIEWLTGKKNHEWEDGDFDEERSNKSRWPLDAGGMEETDCQCILRLYTLLVREAFV
ncbi:unnamed protein product, partial [Dovyalis caffra]